VQNRPLPRTRHGRHAAEDQFSRSNRPLTLAAPSRACGLVMKSALAAHARAASTGVLILHSNQRPTPLPSHRRDAARVCPRIQASVELYSSISTTNGVGPQLRKLQAESQIEIRARNIPCRGFRPPALQL
jgi:hypothetical protein